MSTANWDAGNLKAVAYQGQINEDVMQKIWDISKIPLPLTERIGSGESGNDYKSWTTDDLADPDVTNAQVDGASMAGVNNTKGGERIGNHHQISTKVVRVSTRARNSNTIGRADELAYQVMMRQQELRRDVEAIALSAQASVESAPATSVAGKSAGLFAWIRDTGQATPGNALVPADGAAAGFASGIVATPAIGTIRPLTETLVRDAAQEAYDDGGNPSLMMSVPALIRKFSEYLFTSSARIAALYSDTGQAQEAVTAKGSVNVFVTDFGISLELVPNRIQQLENSDTHANVAILDPDYLELSYLHGYRTEALAKDGLADNRMMAVDWALCPLSLDAHATILSINHTVAVTA